MEGHVIPLNIKAGLPHLSICPHTDQEWDELPHVTMTLDALWDPSILDLDLDDDETWFDAIADPIPDDTFDLTGN